MAIRPGSYSGLSNIAPALGAALATGAAAGTALTVTGIKVGDKLLVVLDMTAGKGNAVAEFTVTADAAINNTGGTSTASHTVLVIWSPRDARAGY